MNHKQLVLVLVLAAATYMANASPLKEKVEVDDDGELDNDLAKYFAYKTPNNEIKARNWEDAQQVRPVQTVQPVQEVSDKYKDIAYNSREVKLVGPNQKEVELKDDAATKMALALDNLKKEASEVWGQVNEKIDKGWGDFKSMIDKAVESAKDSSYGRQLTEALTPKSQIGKTVVMTDKDTYVLPGEPSNEKVTKQISDLVDSAGTKMKGLLKDLGINPN